MTTEHQPQPGRVFVPATDPAGLTIQVNEFISSGLTLATGMVEAFDVQRRAAFEDLYTRGWQPTVEIKVGSGVPNVFASMLSPDGKTRVEFGVIARVMPTADLH